MRRTIQIVMVLLSASGLLLAGLAFGPCVEERKLENGLAGFRVTIVGVEGATGGSGTRADPFDYPDGEITLNFTAEAHDQFGVAMLAYEGDVQLKVTPGELATPGKRVTFREGTAESSVTVRKVFGQVALWLEDVRVVPGDIARGQVQPLVVCQGNNDCPSKAKCFEGSCHYEVKLTTKEGTWATGVSNLVYLRNPGLRQVQWNPWLVENYDSSLADTFVDVDCHPDDPVGPWSDGHGQLVVTGITNEGFFVTDLAHDGNDYNHLYAYNYSYPEDLEIGDRLDRLAGISADFSGATQISFPTWRVALDENLDPRPFRVLDLDGLLPPTMITGPMCDQSSSSHLCGNSKKNWTLEELESSRVRLENLKSPDVYINCDYNGNLQITATYPSPDEETACRDACLKRDGATEIIAKEYVASDEAHGDGTVLPGKMVCPWEASIAGIEPNCVRLVVGPAHVCTELSTMVQFGQWTAALDGGNGPLINMLTRESLVDFDPTEHLGRTIHHVQGNLRQVRAARPRWMVLVGKLPQDWEIEE